jgi:hypothetical protein
VILDVVTEDSARVPAELLLHQGYKQALGGVTVIWLRLVLVVSTFVDIDISGYKSV